jgi:urease accessory protein
VFRSAGGCESDTEARVEEGALLALLPAPAACFSGARFEQRTSVELAAGASLAFSDVLSAGRDSWDFARCRSAISVRREGRALLDEAWLLDAEHGPVRERLGRFQALGTLLLAGPLLDPAAVRDAIQAQPLRPGAPLIQSASPLGSDALVVRLAGERVEMVLAAVREHLGALRAALGDDPWRLDAPHAA